MTTLQTAAAGERQQNAPRAAFRDLSVSAVEAQKSGNWAEALASWEAALELVQDIPGAWRGKAISLERMGRLEESEAAYADGLVQWPDDAPLLFGHARTAERQTAWDNALARWEKARNHCPDRVEAILGISRAFVALNRDNDARAVLEQAVLRWPDHQQARLQLGQFLRQNGEPGEVLQYWHGLAEEMPERADIALTLAQILHELKEDEAAFGKALHAATACTAPAGSHHFERAGELALTLSKQLHPLAEHLALAKELAHKFPDNTLVHSALALCYLQSGKYEEAVQSLRTVIRNTPEDWNAFSTLVQALHQVAAGGSATGNDIEISGLIADLANSGNETGKNFAAFLTDTAHMERRPMIIRPDAVLESDAGSSNVTAIVLGGVQLRHQPFLYSLERYFASRGIKAFMAFDPSGNMGLSGSNSLDRLAAYLTARLGPRAGSRLCILANSAGGLAAVHLGLRLGADQIIGLAACTNLTKEFLAHGQDRRARLTIKRLNENLPRDLLDVRPWLEAAPSRPKIDLFFGAENIGDQNQARHIGHLPSVTQHPIEGWTDHNVIPGMLKLGLFTKKFDNLVLGT